MARFDPGMKEQGRCFLNENSRHYLSHRVQDDLIQTSSEEDINSLVREDQKMKYFSMVLDYT
jgi:hypothetical protein